MPVGDAAVGALHFAAECAGCHTVSDANLVKNHNLTQLVQIIEVSMPLLDPSRCTGNCARDVAAYISQNNPHFSAGASSSSSSSGAPGGSTSSGGLGVVVPAQGAVDAAPVAVHRLNRTEYNNTVRDLFGTAKRPADRFPEDDFGYGFNNIAKVLSVSLTHVEQYYAAADELVEEVLDRALAGSRQQFEAETLGGTSVVAQTGRMMLNRNGSAVMLNLNAAVGGAHQLQVRAGQQAGGSQEARLAVIVDGVEMLVLPITAPDTAMAIYTLPIELSPGPHDLEFEFTNDYWVEGVADRNLVIDWIAVESLAAGDGIFAACDLASGTACLRQMVSEFGLRAWRRPLTTAEVDELVALPGVSAGENPRTALGQVLRALLLSSNFMFRAELDADLRSARAQPLNAYELASRLSYFLWSSMPDSRLFELAANGALLNDSTLRGEVRRMLEDPKADALVENFAVQWLKFDRVLEANPNLERFAGFDAALVASMRQESRLFIKDWLRKNASVSELVTADYSYIDGRLAQHYGVPGISGNQFTRHTWSEGQRRGIIGHASVLTATSHPSNTSPVRRGVWALENLLCKAPPPPPPGVENIADDGSLEGLTTRERFELHRDTSTVCYSCHVMMDPIGFGLENFDAIGRWRDYEGDSPVNPMGTLPGGLSFEGPLELGQIMAESPELPLCVAKHLATYALGRGVDAFAVESGQQAADYPLVYHIYQRTAAGGHRIRDMIEELVVSPAFRMRRGAESEGASW